MPGSLAQLGIYFHAALLQKGQPNPWPGLLATALQWALLCEPLPAGTTTQIRWLFDMLHATNRRHAVRSDPMSLASSGCTPATSSAVDNSLFDQSRLKCLLGSGFLDELFKTGRQKPMSKTCTLPAKSTRETTL